MGNKFSSPPGYYEELGEDIETLCAMELLQRKFTEIIETSIAYPSMTEKKIFNLIVTAKSYGIILPVKILPHTEYLNLEDAEKINYNRAALHKIAEFLGDIF